MNNNYIENNIQSFLIAKQESMYGKLPPQAIDVEEAVLGALMLERDAFINNPVKPEWFYKEEHQKIVSCISELVSESTPIDLLQVTIKLKNKDLLETVGGPLYITQLTSKVSSAAHIEFHIQIIKEKFIRRELIRISSELQIKGYDEIIDIEDIFSSLQTDLGSIMGFGDDKSCSYNEASKELVESLNSTVTTGIKSGFQKFDKFSGGYQKSDLIIIAGETSQGKTSLAVTSLRHCATNKIPCAIFSTEMTQRQLVARLTAQETGISSKRIMYNDLSTSEKKTVLTMIEYRKYLPIYFDDSSVNNVDKICTSIRKLKIKFNIQIVLVDFIQDLKGADTEAGIAEIGRKLKNIAKELDISVIVISQLSRDKANPEPTISRLRGSGQLEEKADVIMMVYRPEYYNRTYSEPHENITTEATAQIKIVKGRNIGIGSFILNFNKETTNFYDYIVNALPAENNDYKSIQSGNFTPNDNFYEKEDKSDAPF